MAKHMSREPLHTEPSQVWAGLDTDHQHRALQLLAQMALNCLTGHAVPPLKEEPLCSNYVVTPSYEPTTSPVRR
jgi:hypothetical protein